VALANATAADVVAARLGQELGISQGLSDSRRLRSEEEFHDDWAAETKVEDVLVRESFEACTAPEHRYIIKTLGDLRGKRVLDLGSGLGEASVYFALQGAAVTACDLSAGMLRVVEKVAAHHGVTVATHQAPAERTGLPDASFDVVYAGNLLHHVDIAPTLDEARRILAPNGVFVSWDPLAHNPVIDVYRRMAGGMRTIDEHPLKMNELSLFKDRFATVDYRCFWFFTLAVFLRFYLEGAHPSKERYWKKILKEAPRLENFYRRLEAWDRALLTVCPWLGRWCWNIVITARKSS
jgi:SAM-dependent methyltransferase